MHILGPPYKAQLIKHIAFSFLHQPEAILVHLVAFQLTCFLMASIPLLLPCQKSALNNTGGDG